MERPHLGQERPSVLGLVREREDLRRDRLWRNEEVVRLVRLKLALPGDIDRRVDDEIRDMDALGAQIARE